jgi:hypothetical protein
VNREFLERADAVFLGQVERLQSIVKRSGERTSTARRRARFAAAATLALALSRHLDTSPRTSTAPEAEFIWAGTVCDQT